MEREIKFKFWLRHTKKMTYEHSLIEISHLAWDFTEDIIPLQYTGLKDKNGKEIYEGDIVKVDNSEPEENGEYDVITTCKWDIGCFILEDNSSGHWTRQLFHQQDRLLVIGNIYETKQEAIEA